MKASTLTVKYAGKQASATISIQVIIISATALKAEGTMGSIKSTIDIFLPLLTLIVVSNSSYGSRHEVIKKALFPYLLVFSPITVNHPPSH